MAAKTLMVVGTTSSAGKSLVVTALCRIFARRGFRVAPFKAQNMSNNAAVCADGSEIGRAQYTQALAARTEPTAAMNPILLKPEANSRSQVVVMGRTWKTLSGHDYFKHKGELWQVVTGALGRLRTEYDLVIMEGAGSPVELNLKDDDIVNMSVARYAQSPVVLVGDIDRGGIFAQMLGTLWLLEDDELELVKGLIVNKFRGDARLFEDGIQILEERSNIPVLGMLPYFEHNIPEEDAVAIEPENKPEKPVMRGINLAIIRLPRIANFDDFDPLDLEPGVNVRYVERLSQFGEPDAVIIPGTKSTINDMLWLRERKLDQAIKKHAARGGSVVGICGGYQMLGKVIRDPELVESDVEAVEGLGLLPVETSFETHKATHQVRALVTDGSGWLLGLRGQVITGYEIHMGTTTSKSQWLRIMQRGDEAADVPDGASDAKGYVWGCYLHGLFHNTNLRRAWLRSVGWQEQNGVPVELDAAFERLADTAEAYLDMHLLETILDL